MDRLEHIFQLQAKFDQALAERRNLKHIAPEEWIQKEVLAIVSELGELLDETNFKWWKNPKPVNQAALREELVDILHFFVSMCIKLGMTAEDLYQGYLEKNKENFDRQQGKSAKSGYEWEVE
ncbi:MAG: dUTPase [Clostridiales bacterium]|nr:dUTPase [Clostridiales bacterium]